MYLLSNMQCQQQFQTFHDATNHTGGDPSFTEP